METHSIVNYMVVVSLCFEGNVRVFTEYPLDIVDSFEDVVPNNLFKYRSKKMLFPYFCEREYFIENFIGDRSWGRGAVFYIEDDSMFLPLGIVRGGVWLETVVYINRELLKKLQQ